MKKWRLGAIGFYATPHLNETEQLEKGLYGALIVRAADELALEVQKILVFDDLRVTAIQRDTEAFERQFSEIVTPGG